MRPALLYSDTQSVVGLSVIPKRMTVNDTDWLFRVKFSFCVGLVDSERVTFQKKNNCMKTKTDTHCQRQNIRQGI